VRLANGPSARKLDQLADLVAATPLDRGGLAAALGDIERELEAHAVMLDQSGGLLDEAERTARPSLAREDGRLREEIATLLREARECRLSAAGAADDDVVRQCTSAVLAALRGHRDAEASLVLESVDTEVGAGD
jgi:1,6-anhydro-N-acetylmuramate kinase